MNLSYSTSLLHFHSKRVEGVSSSGGNGFLKKFRSAQCLQITGASPESRILSSISLQIPSLLINTTSQDTSQRHLKVTSSDLSFLFLKKKKNPLSFQYVSVILTSTSKLLIALWVKAKQKQMTSHVVQNLSKPEYTLPFLAMTRVFMILSRHLIQILTYAIW